MNKLGFKLGSKFFCCLFALGTVGEKLMKLVPRGFTGEGSQSTSRGSPNPSPPYPMWRVWRILWSRRSRTRRSSSHAKATAVSWMVTTSSYYLPNPLQKSTPEAHFLYSVQKETALIGLLCLPTDPGVYLVKHFCLFKNF